MPIYEYKCKMCGRKVEKLSKSLVYMVPCECGETAELIQSMPSRFQRGNGWNARMGGASMPGEA
jgi:putative FmdB family regulatory protein